jgi:hypothetical protein
VYKKKPPENKITGGFKIILAKLITNKKVSLTGGFLDNFKGFGVIQDIVDYLLSWPLVRLLMAKSPEVCAIISRSKQARKMWGFHSKRIWINNHFNFIFKKSKHSHRRIYRFILAVFSFKTNW